MLNPSSSTAYWLARGQKTGREGTGATFLRGYDSTKITFKNLNAIDNLYQTIE